MRSLKLIYIVAITLIVVYLVAEYNKPHPTLWKPTLSYNDKIPYGTYIAYRELKQLFPGAEVKGTNRTFYDQFHDTSIVNSNYIIISGDVKFNKYDFRELLKYLEKGNSVFIATNSYPGKFTGLKNVLADTLKIETNLELKSNETSINFTNNKLKRNKDYKFNNGIASGYFSTFDTSRAVVLGKNGSGDPNFISYKFGKGTLFLCANPELFTNYSLLSEQGADYAAKALSYMPVQPVVYWDHFQNGDIEKDMSPLRVFFSNPSLQWAYYLSLGGMLIFILYEMKRRQRIIPIIEPLRNSTVDFVNVVGQVYYEQRNNANIAQKKVVYFLEHLRTVYHLKTNVLDKEFIERLAQKTGIGDTLAGELVMHLHYINGQRVTDDDLIKLNQLIEQFYIKSR
ncbi:DUF4350 domain-containing protein [Mucilaginibacter ginsenosidivorans]|uniref:DUF4350 domain-containing protein n=1 Tax=Mucilaginibacter ginsenosidivorans TaxID=398053 RepID=A0A5B8UQW4_9SPHI|nr:DUF4350 domain-containing protein [Mucilaginibacter ginsenosidivorans]QEC61075.1 DUF4350 domain-containing protein [Mucilaginibacter ginsenosidivorans]